MNKDGGCWDEGRFLREEDAELREGIEGKVKRDRGSVFFLVALLRKGRELSTR